MLRGDVVRLRSFIPQDVPDYVKRINDPGRRTARRFNPVSRSAVSAAYGRDAFISDDFGLLALDLSDRPHIGYGSWRLASSAVGNIEICVEIYDSADDTVVCRGDAYGLLCRHLFDNRPVERIQLLLHPGDSVGRDGAAGVGFEREGILTSIVFMKGAWRDLELWSVLRVLREELDHA